MTTTFKEGTNGFYCAECRMSFGEPQATCPYCGSIVTNWIELQDKIFLQQFQQQIEGELSNESNVSRTN